MIARREVLGLLAASAVAGPVRAEPVAAGVMRLDPGLNRIVDATAPVEVLGRGYRWAEGPVWDARRNRLLFGDPQANTVYSWTAARGVALLLHPSGLQTPVPPEIREAGANGLAFDAQGRLVAADSGTRAIVRIDLETKARTILADRFDGKRFNSPNDLVIARDGTVYFTDPPYGLAGADESPLREQVANGLYRLGLDGRVQLLDGTHRRPNGVGLSLDGRTLYLSLSDEKQPELLAYTLDARGTPTGVRRFHDMRAQLARGWPGLPDGMDVAPDGTVFATGPGGVHVLTPAGRLLGIIATGKAVANCCIGERGKSLFLTSSDQLCRIPLRQRG